MIDVLDYRMLRDAGLLLDDIDQNLPLEELSVMTEWQEYVSIVDQNPEDTMPEEPQEETCFIVRVFRYIINFFKRVFAFIF